MKKIIALIVITVVSSPCYAQELKFSTISEQINESLSLLTKRFMTGEFHRIIPREKDRDCLRYAVSQANRASNIIIATQLKHSQPFLISLQYDIAAFTIFLNTADAAL